MIDGICAGLVGRLRANNSCRGAPTTERKRQDLGAPVQDGIVSARERIRVRAAYETEIRIKRASGVVILKAASFSRLGS